jgi:hypothetical protein
MSHVKINAPRQWEDWCDWLFGIWLLLSPWTLTFESESSATRNAVIVGILIIGVALLTLSIFRAWEEWLNVILGAWLLASPWILGVRSTSATINFVILGALVLALALYEINMGSRRRHA